MELGNRENYEFNMVIMKSLYRLLVNGTYSNVKGTACSESITPIRKSLLDKLRFGVLKSMVLNLV